ncbi:MAG TPA: hypothetical protein PKI32_04420 [Opitutales bacterium]|nr:hypothetical protein [Opitutales bacterium]
MRKLSLFRAALPAAFIGILSLAGCVVDSPPDSTTSTTVFVHNPDVIPDTYIWDGYEYVGFIGGNYYYLGPDDYWLICDNHRLDRFRHWERNHPDWRRHATRNDHHRKDRHGRIHPPGEDRPDGHGDRDHKEHGRPGEVRDNPPVRPPERPQSDMDRSAVKPLPRVDRDAPPPAVKKPDDRRDNPAPRERDRQERPRDDKRENVRRPLPPAVQPPAPPPVPTTPPPAATPQRPSKADPGSSAHNPAPRPSVPHGTKPDAPQTKPVPPQAQPAPKTTDPRGALPKPSPKVRPAPAPKPDANEDADKKDEAGANRDGRRNR